MRRGRQSRAYGRPVRMHGFLCMLVHGKAPKAWPVKPMCMRASWPHLAFFSFFLLFLLPLSSLSI
jgi:hypothetical protein